MRKFKFIFYLLILFIIGCKPTVIETNNGIEVFDTTKVGYFYNYSKLCVPIGTKNVYLENGNNVNLLSVDPIPNSDNIKNAEPFGTVKVLFKSDNKTKVSVYYSVPSDFEEDSMHVTNIYVLQNCPINKIAYGSFGETKYVQIANDYSFNRSKDIYIYNQEHNHTLHYVYGYAKLGNGEGYVLTDMYNVVNGIIVSKKYDDNILMPWDADDFIPNGNQINNSQLRASLEENNIIEVKLPEPSNYVTNDDGQTFYHSSGCVFFEDSWPEANQGGVYDTDFNDCVIDYDIEARTVSDEKLSTDAWREQVKVVLHLRAVGSNIPYRVGLKLEGFDQNNVEYIEQFFSLDSYENPHGFLPEFTESTIQRNSGHYENDPMNPIVEMAHIFTMNQERAGVGSAAEYDYINGDFTNHTVFNLTYGFKPEDESQYDPALKTITSPTKLSDIQKKKWYNAIPGYVNVAGGLVTYTVIYHMNNRSLMTPQEREEVKQNMIETVINTKNQNFYIINNDFTPVGLKGYDPVLLHNQSVSKYNTKYNNGVTSGTLSTTIPYYGTNGNVWGIKCPPLTRHIWNKLYFSSAYPHYEEWVQSNGEQHQNWYNEDINEIYLTCWW